MMRGSVNERPVLSWLSSRKFVQCVFKFWIFAMKSFSWIECSFDAVDWIHADELGLTNETYPVLPSVKTKTADASSSLGRTIAGASQKVVACSAGDEVFRRCIPLAKFYTNPLFLKFHTLFTSQSVIPIYSSSVMRKFLVHFATPTFPLFVTEWSLIFLGRTIPMEPSALDTSIQRTLAERHPFWKMLNDHVHQQGSIPVPETDETGIAFILFYDKKRSRRRNAVQICSTFLRNCFKMGTRTCIADLKAVSCKCVYNLANQRMKRWAVRIRSGLHVIKLLRSEISSWNLPRRNRISFLNSAEYMKVRFQPQPYTHRHTVT